MVKYCYFSFIKVYKNHKECMTHEALFVVGSGESRFVGQPMGIAVRPNFVAHSNK